MINLPNETIAEITLIGTGGGYGESSVVHLGYNEWMVVDSCINPENGDCLPLKYLTEIGVDVATQVRMIVCTHWHDDHILGISKLFQSCESADFCFARATDRKKFLYFVNLDYEKSRFGNSISSTTEFVKCIEIARVRKNAIKSAVSDKILLSFNNKGFERSVASLSPSDLTLDDFSNEISALITEFGEPNKKIVIQSPNDKSIALYIRFHDHCAILGADLEIGSDRNKGWLDILNNSKVIKAKASLFKIPHHGSSNGYSSRIWTQLLTDNPVSKLTPWNKSNRLPDPDMLTKFCSHSEQVYMTSPIINLKPKRRDKQVDKLIKNFGIALNEVKYSRGIVRCRLDFTSATSNWEVSLFDQAICVNDTIAN